MFFVLHVRISDFTMLYRNKHDIIDRKKQVCGGTIGWEAAGWRYSTLDNAESTVFCRSLRQSDKTLEGLR